MVLSYCPINGRIPKSFSRESRRVHAVRNIMGNQGKIAKKQSGKIYVFLHISVLSFIFEKKNFYCK